MSHPRYGNGKANRRGRKAGRTRMSAKQRAAKVAAQLAGYREAGKAPPAPLTMTPTAAWQELCVRTGAAICRTTFYRWISTMKVYSVRMGYRIYVPRSELDRLVKICLEGMWL